MDYKTLDIYMENNIGCITLNRPEVMNALNRQMRAEITASVNELSKEARVVVITGHGSAFCSGQDLGDRATASNLDMEHTLRDEYEPMLKSIIDCPVPTITALNGAAAGAGANLALAADVVIGAHSAYLMQAFTRIGLMPDAGGTFIMPRTIGMAKSMGAAFFAEKISSEQADRWGLIWESVPDEEFEETWKARAAHLAQGPTVAYQNIKKAFRVSLDNSLEAQLSLEAKLQKSCGSTRDFSEGVTAFMQKRPAKFEGR